MSIRAVILSLAFIILSYLAGRFFFYKPDQGAQPPQTVNERTVPTTQSGSLIVPDVIPTATRVVSPSTLPAASPTTIGTIASTPVATRTPLPNGSTTHVIVKGDTLYSIAARYSVTLDALKKANNLTGDEISLGQVLVIPKPGP